MQSSARRIAQLALDLPRRRAVVPVGDERWRLETLDDLDDAIDRLVGPLADDAHGHSTAEICPHFGVVWPAALALCEQLHEIFADWDDAAPSPHVLELGCGLALPSMLARRLGAARVVATDRHPLAGQFLERNAAANGIFGIEYRIFDWRRPEPSFGTFDLVIGSDLLYEAWQPGYLADVMMRCLKPGGYGIVADPGRRYVDEFVGQVEASGGLCDLEAVRTVPRGSSTVDVSIVIVRA